MLSADEDTLYSLHFSYGNDQYIYTYNSDGLRIRKEKTGGEKKEYYYVGGRLIRETMGSDTIWYLYDNNGMIGFELNGISYYYVRNLHGDVTRIVNGSAQTVVTYSYDSWGKLLSVSGTLSQTIGLKNPIRYRGYYYDNESNGYHLNSRYYDPEVGRFISPDVLAEGGNLYAYCVNDPVNRSDESGYLSTFGNG